VFKENKEHKVYKVPLALSVYKENKEHKVYKVLLALLAL
jgi:hypothetical protein